MKKKEFIFIGALLAVSVLLCVYVYVLPHVKYGSIQITVIAIGDTNVCEIKNGEVKMTEANCPDHLCMKQPAVGSAGGYIVCLPNKVVIQGEGEGDADPQDSDGGFDAVV